MQIFAVAAGLLGGLALFLFGVDRISRSLQAAGGDSVRTILERLSQNAVTGALTGVVVTAILQASAVTISIAIGFVSANLMTLERAIPIVLGSNVGTTSTAYLASVDIGPWAYLLIAVGFATSKFAKRGRIYYLGGAIAALGLVLVGLELMKESMVPLRSWEPFVDLMAATTHPFVGISLGFAMTALVQSSTATIGLAVALASAGLLGLDGGIAIALGANIGSIVMPVIASLDKSAEAKRVAAVQVIFNVVGVGLWVGLIPQLASISQRFTSDVAGQLAVANTFFNTVNMLLFLPFTKQLAALARKLVSGPTAREGENALDAGLIETPALALDVAWRGVTELGRSADGALSIALASAIAGKPAESEDDSSPIDRRRKELVEYLGRIAGSDDLDSAQRRRVVAAIVCADLFAAVGTDVVANLTGVARRRSDAGFTFEGLRPAADAAQQVFAQAVASFESFPATHVLPTQPISIAPGDVTDAIEAARFEMGSWILTQIELVTHAAREADRALERARLSEREAPTRSELSLT